MRLALALFLGLAFSGPALASTIPLSSPVPQPRPEGAQALVTKVSTSNIAFSRWIDGFRQRARAAGIRDSVFDAAFLGVRYQTDVIQRDRNQSQIQELCSRKLKVRQHQATRPRCGLEPSQKTVRREQRVVCTVYNSWRVRVSARCMYCG